MLGALEFNPVLVGRYTDLTRDAVFYLDPHVCVRCRYRSTERGSTMMTASQRWHW